MPADLRQTRHRAEKPVVEMPRVRARKPDAVDAVDLVDRFEETREVAGGVVRRVVMVDDLAEELYLGVSGRRRFADLRQDVGLRTHALVPARVGHDTEAAELVAALDD